MATKKSFVTPTVPDLVPLIQVHKPKFENLFSCCHIFRGKPSNRRAGSIFREQQILLKHNGERGQHETELAV